MIRSIFRKKAAPLNADKLTLIDYAFSHLGARSFADLGGVWGVEGGYAFYALDQYKPERAVMVDGDPSDLFLQKARGYPSLEFIEGNYGDPAIARQVSGVDTIFLFDNLLHQVRPDWDEVLEMYGAADTLLVFNQQWRGEQTVRLIELGEDEYFRNVPHQKDESPYNNLFAKLDTLNADHNRPWRDVFNIWQWGITDDDLLARAKHLGYRLAYYKDCGPFGRLPNCSNRAFVFTRR